MKKNKGSGGTKPDDKAKEPAKPPIDYTPRQERKWREASERNPWPPGRKAK